MNKTVKIVIAILVVVFIVIPTLAWFLFKSDPENTTVETTSIETVVVDEPSTDSN